MSSYYLCILVPIHYRMCRDDTRVIICVIYMTVFFKAPKLSFWLLIHFCFIRLRWNSTCLVSWIRGSSNLVFKKEIFGDVILFFSLDYVNVDYLTIDTPSSIKLYKFLVLSGVGTDKWRKIILMHISLDTGESNMHSLYSIMLYVIFIS